MKISYPFPIVCLDEEDPEEGEIIQCSGLLTPIRVDHEPYEAVVEARGYRFHILEYKFYFPYGRTVGL